MKKILENRWIMINIETKGTWAATIANTKQMCIAMAAESLALDGRTLGETKFKPNRKEKLSEAEREIAREILQRVYDCMQFDPDISEPGDTPHSYNGRWTDGGRFIISMSRVQVLALEEIIKKI